MRVASLLLCFFIALMSCDRKDHAQTGQAAVDPWDTSVTSSFTVAIPNSNGEGVRITYTFFNMRKMDTGDFRMTHVYIHLNGKEDTAVVTGTWKYHEADTDFVRLRWGKHEQDLFLESPYRLIMNNVDTMMADSGRIEMRLKKDNDLRNSTVYLDGGVKFFPDKNAVFYEADEDTLPVLKVSAFAELSRLHDSLDFNSPAVKGVQLLGTIQVRMAMDGKSVQRGLIVEEVLSVRK